MLSGCTKSPVNTLELPKCFVTSTEISVGDTVYGAVLSRFSDGYWQIELDSPAAVKGLIFTISGADTEVSFDGLRFTFDTSRFPVGSVVSDVISRLDRRISKPIDVISGDEQSLATGKIDDEGYTLTLSKTNIPQKLELVESGMTIVFDTFDIAQIEE